MVIDNDLCMPVNDILKHYGIDGQKWGVTNGPPYPLDPNKDYSKKELRAYKREIRKQYRKEVKRRKKNIKKYKKEEEERIREEEAKKKAISSGSISEVEKYKDKMTNEELEEAMKRIRVIQDFDRVKIDDIRTTNEEIRENLNKISVENDLKKEELMKAYGPGKGEAILDKTARIAGKVGDIASNAKKVTDLLSAQTVLNEKNYKLSKRKKDDESKSREDKKNRLIEKVINSGDENLINKHLNKMSNDQLQKAMDRLDMLNPEKETIERVVKSGDEKLLNKYLNQMSNSQVKEAIERINLLYYDKDEYGNVKPVSEPTADIKISEINKSLKKAYEEAIDLKTRRYT